MKYYILTKDSSKSLEVKKLLEKRIKGTVNEQRPDVVFSIGGDGTVLEAVRKYIDIIEDVIIVAVHTGNLGFYTQFLPKDIDLICNAIESPKEYIRYPLLEFDIDGSKDYALNEITVSSGHKLLRAGVGIDQEHFMDIVANGVCVSTPSGSTAYNKSLGGAIMDPTLNAVQLTLIAPFQTVGKTMISPFIVSDKHQISIKPENKQIEVSFDREIKRVENVKEISVKISNRKVKFLKIEEQPFIRRVKEKFISKN